MARKPLTPEHKAALSTALRGKKHKTHVLTEEGRRLRSAAARRRWSDPEQRLAQSVRLKQMYSEDPTIVERIRAVHLGSKRSEETRQRMRDSWTEDKRRDQKEVGYRGARAAARSNPSYPEEIVARYLDQLGVPYQRQVRLDDFLVDFLILERVVLEVDGQRWHSRPENVEHDRKRDTRLEQLGFVVYRVQAKTVTRKHANVTLDLLKTIAERDTI